MASLSRRPQSVASQSNGGFATSFGTSRNASRLPPSDPLQPLRAMAERVGKEVEKFAERVDQWHTQGNDDAVSKYQSTLKMVGSFRDLAASTVKELKKQTDEENQGALNQSVRRRIQNMAQKMDEAPNESVFARSTLPAIPSIEPSTASDSSSVQELRQWQAELATWELLRVVIDHYHPAPNTDVAKDRIARLKDVGGASRYNPNKEVWDRFLLEDDHAKEKEIILRWLEQTAQNSESDIDSITDNLKALSGKDTDTWTTGWLDTKFKIKQGKRMQGIENPLDPSIATIKSSDKIHSLVTQLDPDAPMRQKRSLEKADEYYERALWMICYEMLRRGETWESINEWFKERNEAWRGISIGAAYESHPGGIPNVAGPNFGYLFRRMAFYAARGARIPYEAAVYGLLSGDLRAVEGVCRSWDDQLYAHYNSLLLSRFDKHLRDKKLPEKLTGKFTFHDAVANLGPWESSSSQVIQLLKQHKTLATQSLSPMKLIQGSLIAQDMDELAYKVGTAIAILLQEDDRSVNMIIDPDSHDAPGPKTPHMERVTTAEKYHQTLATDPHALRVLVHILITLRGGLGLLHDGSEFSQRVSLENVIAAYIEFLRTSKRLQLVPLYAAQLSIGRQRHCLARILPDVKNPTEQKDFVKLMGLYRIDSVDVVSEGTTFARRSSGLIRAETDETETILNHISRYVILEQIDDKTEYLWPGQRIKEEFPGLGIEPKEEAIIDSLSWYHHLERDLSNTFGHLEQSLLLFLLNGRVGAAEKLITEMSLENISLAKTQALCGYAFDFTHPGSEEQDENEMSRQALSGSARDSIRPSEIPSPEEHAMHVQDLREVSARYAELQQIVRLIALFREWRVEEEELLKGRSQGAKKPTKRIKDVFDSINATIGLVLECQDPRGEADVWDLYKAYIPEILIGYLAILQTACYFIHRDSATKAMDLATIIADTDNPWLQSVFLETGRMSELVDTLAMVSKAMLQLNDAGEGKRAGAKKRGSKGETIKIWDVNVRN